MLSNTSRCPECQEECPGPPNNRARAVGNEPVAPEILPEEFTTRIILPRKEPQRATEGELTANVLPWFAGKYNHRQVGKVTRDRAENFKPEVTLGMAVSLKALRHAEVARGALCR